MEQLKELEGQISQLAMPLQDGELSGTSGPNIGQTGIETAPNISLYEQVLKAHGQPLPDSESIINGKSGGSFNPDEKSNHEIVLTSDASGGVLFTVDRQEPKSDPKTQTVSDKDITSSTPKLSLTATLSNYTYTGQRLDDSYSDDTQND